MKDSAGWPAEGTDAADVEAALVALRAQLAAAEDAPRPVLGAAVRSGLECAAAWDPTQVDDTRLLAAAGELERAQRFLDAARVHVAAEVDARGATVAARGLHTVGWYGALHGLSRGAASKLVRTGRKLRDRLDVVDDALTNGETTLDHAAHLARQCQPRVEDTVAAAQAAFLALAHGARFEAWADQVRDLIRLADDDGARDPRPEDNTLHVANGLNGEAFLTGTLVGDDAVTFREAVIALADQLQLRAVRDHEHSNDLPVPPRSELLALALAELVRRGHAATDGRAPVVEATLVIPAGDPTHPDRPAPTDSHTPPDGHVPQLLGLAWTPLVRDRHGVPLHDATTRVLCCDAAIGALVVDHLGTPLDHGHHHRYATPDQRRALALRDGGCIFPGCDAPPEWCDAHHVEPWDPHRRAGPTDLANLALTCRHHHRIIHRPAWSMRATGDQHLEITTPTGQVLPCQRHGRPPPHRPPPSG